MRPADETSAEINALSENRVMQKCMSFLIHGAWGPIWNHSRRGGLHKGTRLCENPPGPPGTASVIATWGVQTSWNRLPQGPIATQQGAWHQRIDDNPLTAQIPGFSHCKIRLGPTFHTVWNGFATTRRPTGFQWLLRCETVLHY